MNGCAVPALFPAHYGMHRVAATPHCSADRLRERGRSFWTFVQVECHMDAVSLLMLINSPLQGTFCGAC